MKKTVLFSLLFLVVASSYGQTKKERKAKEAAELAAKNAPPAPPKPDAPKAPSTGPKAYKEVVTAKAKTSKGLITIHKIEDKYLFEIPDSVFNREIMAITRFAKTPTDAGYGGEEANKQVLRFTKGPDNKVFLKLVTFINVADSSQNIVQAVKNSNAEAIVGAFDVKAIKKDTSVVIDVTDFFKGDNQVVSLPATSKQFYKLTALMPDRSYIESIKTFPINVEIKSVKTFGTMPPSITPSPIPVPGVTLPQGARAGVITAEMNTSLILLPLNPAPKRLWDARVGYFANRYTVYADDAHDSKVETFIVRWKLEPKNAAYEAKQKAGELIEPKKPIVYYIDPATPKRWVPFLIAGINDWQKAFEQAGWKNAIMGKEVPAGDTTITTEDARFSFVRYFASDIENAYGPNVHDPRSGEILESHIGWYHNVMSLVYKWYLIQTAAVDPRARKPKFDDELMGQLIRFVSSHEVGHTLGLPHNFGSSHATPVEKLRDKAYTDANGHTPSIMDYARFNYVAQPGDGVTDFFPRIGAYDNWSIEWGYKPVYGAKNADEEKKELNKWVTAKAGNPTYFYGTQGNPYDPRSQSECLGDNNMKASDYGIKNLKRIVPNLNEWLKEDAEDFDKLAEVYRELVSQYRRYIGHVVTNIGGIYDSPKTSDQSGTVYEPTPKVLQKDAVRFVNEHVFQTPSWLLDKSILSRVTPGSGVESIRNIQEASLNSIFDVARLQRIIECNSSFNDTYLLDDLFVDVQTGIFSELSKRSTIDNFRRNLQKTFVEKLILLMNTSTTPPPAAFNFAGFRVQPSPTTDAKKSDIVTLARVHLLQIKTEIAAAKIGISDKMSKYHLDDLQDRIEKAMNPK
jgi:Met-zincin/Domain of unknown function (DUF5117)/Domain of unknown function (DUF5118)